MKVTEIQPFTPGPLRAERADANYADEDNLHIVACQSDDVLAGVAIDTRINNLAHHGLANARLYSASPDLFAGVETALFWAFVSEDDAKFSPLYRAYFKALRGDYPALDTSQFLRVDYFLMICGSIESTRWSERRKTTAAEFEEFGEWRNAEYYAPDPCWCLAEGDYVDWNGDLLDGAILPAWYQEDEFNCTVGKFSVVRQWMRMPQLEDVFQSALWREVQRGSTENDADEEEETNDEC